MNTTILNLMERAFEAYSEERIDAYEQEVYTNGLSEHGFPRLTADLGILIANGRKTEQFPRFLRMMDFCCEQIPRVLAHNDFSVKEIIFCILEVQKHDTVPAERIGQWLDQLRNVTKESYNKYAKSPEDTVANWAIFTAVSEWMRTYVGLCDATDFVDLQIESQYKRIDKNGMYEDPNMPMVYDLVSRGLFSVLLHFGYRGKHYAYLNDCLRRAGLLTLRMQSVTGEIPFGGRSNQFLHNEAQFAIIAEFEANRYAKEGNLTLAGNFKYVANEAIAVIAKGLEQEPIYHIKNRFPTEMKYGCEGYGYFNKYMITAASFLYVVSLLSDDSIVPVKPNADGFLALDDNFHKAFLRRGNYCAELETHEDANYDANGIGRIHRRGAPSTICLSVPGTATPHYSIGDHTGVFFSIAPGITENGVTHYALENDVPYTLLSSDDAADAVRAVWRCDFPEGKRVNFTVAVSDTGVTIKADSEGETVLMLPAFSFDGAEHPTVTCAGNELTVAYRGWICRYMADCPIRPTDTTGWNRNGAYDLYRAAGNRHVEVKVTIEKG